MLRSYLRDEFNLLMRHDILSLEQIERAIEVAERASFLDRAPSIETSVASRRKADQEDAPMPVEVAG
jgi:hypothetical protein